MALFLGLGFVLLAGPQVVAQRGPAPSPAASPATHTAWSPRNANYDIAVTLDPVRHTLVGRQTIRWRNITGRPTSELQFHLYWNAWRNERSTWLRERRLSGGRNPEANAFGSIDVSALRVRVASGGWVDATSMMRFISPDDNNADDRTVVQVPLSVAVPPQGTADVNIEWAATIPRPFERTGYVGDYYFVGQWFPKIGVLQNDGWNTHQFHEHTEFYSDYGVYDVAITAPAKFVIGGTGCSQSPASAPACSGSTGTDNGDGTRTHRFHAEDVHDFAWTASPHFLDRSRLFEHPGLPPVRIRLLLQPERAALAERYFSITAATLRLYGQWFGPYPYGHLTIVDPAFQSESAGMEYPTLITGRARWLAPAAVQTPEMTTAHETGHQWWHGMVGSNEVEHAWLDEGINTYATARVLDEVFKANRVESRFFGGFVPWATTSVPFSRLDNDRLAGYRQYAEVEVPSTPTWRQWPATSAYVSYNKTALWMHTLERMLGWPAMQRILSTYFERYRFRHPTPDDFFAVVNEVGGRDLRWFFDEVHRSSNTFDYAVQDLRSERLDDGRYRTTVVISRLGEATFPVDVLTTFAGGGQARQTWDGVARRAVFTYDRAERATAVAVDPDRVLLLDTHRINNSRSLSPSTGRASLRWALTWVTWLQQTLLSYGFFA